MCAFVSHIYSSPFCSVERYERGVVVMGMRRKRGTKAKSELEAEILLKSLKKTVLDTINASPLGSPEKVQKAMEMIDSLRAESPGATWAAIGKVASELKEAMEDRNSREEMVKRAMQFAEDPQVRELVMEFSPYLYLRLARNIENPRESGISLVASDFLEDEDEDEDEEEEDIDDIIPNPDDPYDDIPRFVKFNPDYSVFFFFEVPGMDEIDDEDLCALMDELGWEYFDDSQGRIMYKVRTSTDKDGSPSQVVRRAGEAAQALVKLGIYGEVRPNFAQDVMGLPAFPKPLSLRRLERRNRGGDTTEDI